MPCRREPIYPAVQVDLTGRETLNAIPSDMAEQNQMSSELSSIDPLALSWVEYWHPFARKGLLIGCSIAVVAAVVSVGFYRSYGACLTCAISCPIGALRRFKSKLEQPKQTCSAQKQIFQGRRLGWLRRMLRQHMQIKP